MADIIEDLKSLVRTRHALVTILTLEEAYAARVIRQAGADMGRAVMEWSISDGLRTVIPPGGTTISGTVSLVGALRYIRDNNDPIVYILKESLKHLADPSAERLLRDIAQEEVAAGRSLFLIDPAGDLPSSLHPMSMPFDLALPDEQEIAEIVKKTAVHLSQYSQLKVELNRQEKDQFLANLKGLTRMEVAQVVADAVLNDQRIGPEDVGLAAEAKRRRLRQTGVLDYIPPPDSTPDVGGMETLRKWLERRAGSWTAQAKKFGLDNPKGILMLGAQGCGKSLMAHYVAAQWKVPLLRMDVGALFDKYIGESERNLRSAFKVANAMAPCVLWIDEIEKAFASAGIGLDGAKTDGGLSQRMFGMLLSWMQDHKDPVFIVATANDITALPPEMLRKGRFDEVFFVDLPQAPVRKSIFEIHLARRQRKPKNFDLDALAQAAEGFSGSEIEQAVVSALYTAFGEKRDITSEDIHKEILGTRPLSVLMAEKVAALRAWAADRCVKAD